MSKYWIIVNGRPEGPYTVEQLRARRDFTATLPVWNSGYADWTTAGAVPELAALLTGEQPEAEQPQPVGNYVEQTVEQTPAPQPAPQPRMAWVQPAAEIDGEKRPSTYLGWNIFMTICCCTPAGIIGIIFSSMVNQKWQRGDVDGPKKASEGAAWCLILAIVLGLVGWPFQMLFSMLG